MGVETAIILAGIAAGTGTAVGSTIAAGESAGAAEKGAELTTAATNKATDAKTASDQAALAFQQQQAENSWKADEATRKANYDLYAAQQQRYGSIGQMIGLPARNIPAYVPTQDPNFTSGQTPLPSTQTAPTGTTSQMPGSLNSIQTTPTSSGGPLPTGGLNNLSGNPTDTATITKALQGIYQSLGVNPSGPGSGPTDIAYYAQKVAETGGWTPSNAGYWTDRIKGDLAKSQGGGAKNAAPSATSPSSQTAPYTGSLWSLMPQAPGVLTPPLSPGY